MTNETILLLIFYGICSIIMILSGVDTIKEAKTQDEVTDGAMTIIIGVTPIVIIIVIVMLILAILFSLYTIPTRIACKIKGIPYEK